MKPVAELLKEAQTGKPFINQKRYTIRKSVRPAIKGRKEYPRRPKMARCALGVCYRKRRKL
jgi:hypothetical protein